MIHGNAAAGSIKTRLVSPRKDQQMKSMAVELGFVFGMALAAVGYFKRYLDIFKLFKGTLDHLLTRTQSSRCSVPERLSGDLRRSCFLKKRPRIEKVRRLSLPVLLSMNARSFFGIELTSVHRSLETACRGCLESTLD